MALTGGAESMNHIVDFAITEFYADLEAALARVLARLGIDRAELNPADCRKFTFSNCPAVAFTYKGQLVLLSSGPQLEIAMIGRMHWWIKEMV